MLLSDRIECAFGTCTPTFLVRLFAFQDPSSNHDCDGKKLKLWKFSEIQVLSFTDSSGRMAHKVHISVHALTGCTYKHCLYTI